MSQLPLKFIGWSDEGVWNILSQMRSSVLYLLRSEERSDPERGLEYAKLLSRFAALGLDLEGEGVDATL